MNNLTFKSHNHVNLPITCVFMPKNVSQLLLLVLESHYEIFIC